MPLTAKALEAIESLPPHLDSALLFPAVRGGFERSVLSPVPYVLRHTFASNALAAGVGTFELARVMGTSLEMIERTYGHLVRGADDAFRSRLDAFAANRGERDELAQ